MPENQMLGLIKLAWERSSGGIHDLIGMFFGAAIFVFFMFIFSLQNFLVFNPAVNYQLPEGAFDIYAAYTLAISYGFINTVFILIFMFILVGLAWYTIEFVILCYHYDNESWEVICLINRGSNAITDWFRRDAADARAKKAKRVAEIKSDISRLKSSDEL